MTFIGQVALSPELFGSIPGRMAYLFITDDQMEESLRTWDPDGGENAVVVQPQGVCSVDTTPLRSGPSLESTRTVSWIWGTTAKYSVEYAVETRPGLDHDSVAVEEALLWSERRQQEYFIDHRGCKVGGSPAFLHFDKEEERLALHRGDWRLLVQLEGGPMTLPITGDAPILYAFLNREGNRGLLTWQGH